ncbi:hypothetical protein SBI_09164 [Streptomyces bingchenggensis BCW-1]|uniref:Uncharacterized protein n=1 Tax=Streptomyces bingchenggensis (strain BCW-1) TaxID=749414 RepID=D7C3R6_STRBB|nr:hypothetical protein SBI_09164 [Streptomyces bingchenggensis BCW-1]
MMVMGSDTFSDGASRWWSDCFGARTGASARQASDASPVAAMIRDNCYQQQR